MKKVLLAAVTAITFSAGSAFAADLPVKAVPVVAPPPAPMWDVAFGGIVQSDYIFRGISQSNRGPSGGAYFEPQLITQIGTFYVGAGALAINWTAAYGFSDPSAEVDFWGGWRNTWGMFSLDLGVFYYYYPKELGGIDSDFVEFYGKVGFQATPDLSFGLALFYTPDMLNYGGTNLLPNDAEAFYLSGTAKWVTPFKVGELGMYVSGELAYWFIDDTGFVAVGGTDPSYMYYNAGLAFTYKALTLDLRWHGNDMSTTECANYLLVAPANQASRWCGDTFVVGAKFDTTLNALK
jgi:uncharacterized protein (TIGR02001 family)